MVKIPGTIKKAAVVPNNNPLKNRLQSVFSQMPRKLSDKSTVMGTRAKKNRYLCGVLDLDKFFMNGNASVPDKKPIYKPKHLAHTAHCLPQTKNDRSAN